MATMSNADMSRSGRRTVTIADIAQLAGVSAPTVSKVVNGRPEVAPDTRAHVEQVIRENGYRPPRRAPKSARLIELVFHELAGVYPIEILRGVEKTAADHHLGVVVSESNGGQTPDRGWLEEALGRCPVGIIAVFSDFSPEQYAQLAVRGIPLVVLDPNGMPDDEVPSVGATNWLGGLSATRHLLKLGHRRIAVITGPPWALCSRARVDGYRAALEMAGVPVDPALIREGGFSVADSAMHATDLLRLADPPTAIFAFNDAMAIGVCHAASLANLRVPQDLSVVGFDDHQLNQWLSPALTTVRQPLGEMGATAARMILDLSRGIEPSARRVELATELVVRASTAPPPTGTGAGIA